jgi:hypothetical protein
VALAGAGGSHEARVLLGLDPLERGEVVKARPRDRGDGDVEVLERLRDGKAGLLEARQCIGGVPAGDLGLDEGPQQLLRCPALGPGDDEELGGDAAHGGELQAT